MAFAAALSEHPLATHAVGEVVGQVVLRKYLRDILAFTALAGLLGLLLAGPVLGTVRALRVRERRAADVSLKSRRAISSIGRAADS